MVKVNNFGWPKSYHFKTVMARLLKELQDRQCDADDEPLDKIVIFKGTLEYALTE